MVYSVQCTVYSVIKKKEKNAESTVTGRNLVELLINLLVSKLPDSFLINSTYQYQ